MTFQEIDHWMTQITDILTNVSGKLNQVGDLNLALGKKLDRLAATVDRLATDQIEANRRLADTVDKLATEQVEANRHLDRLAGTVDKLATEQVEANRRFEHLTGTVDQLATEQVEANRRFNDRFERDEERFDRLIQALEKRG